MDILTESPQPAAPAQRRHPAAAWVRAKIQSLRNESPWEFVVLVLMTGFLLFYGLVPLFGGDQVGLVGADEPRYAQIAREMLRAHNQICGELQRRDRSQQPPPDGHRELHPLPGRRHRHSDPVWASLAGEAGALLLARHGLLPGVRRGGLVGPAARGDRRRAC